MGTLYLVDAHNSTLGSSKINDTVNLPFGTVQGIRGSFPVNLPFDVPLDATPIDLTDLLTKKYAGILSLYPGYSNILYDAQIDEAGWDVVTVNPGNDSGAYSIGSRQNNSLNALEGSSLLSDVTTLASTPGTFILRWETFEYSTSNTVADPMTRNYEETNLAGLPDPGLTVSVTFNNLASWVFDVQNGVPTSVPLVDQGDDFRIRFQNDTGERVWLGSWELIY